MENRNIPVAICGIGTAVPSHRLVQTEVYERLSEALQDNPDAARWSRRIFRQCGVETRYTCEPNLLEPASRCRYTPGTPPELIPSTEERMESYRLASIPLALEAARLALQSGAALASDITHLMTVSCTGMFLPGLDAALFHELRLAPDVQRIPLQFIGCAAGLTAVRMAADIVRDRPFAKVLIVCVELCTLHIQPSSARDDLFGASMFGDGASSCLVCSPTQRHHALFSLGKSQSVLLPGGADDMRWGIGSYGFSLYLSPRIPELIGKYVPEELNRFWDGEAAPELWAIHPGGRGIIDTLQKLYHLTDEQTEASRSILRRYGNLSSVTILFVLQELRGKLEAAEVGPKEGVALAFGPGLNAEMLRIGYVPTLSVMEAVPREAHA